MRVSHLIHIEHGKETDEYRESIYIEFDNSNAYLVFYNKWRDGCPGLNLIDFYIRMDSENITTLYTKRRRSV